jgi:hypothetical protein
MLAAAVVQQHAETFRAFPPRQSPGSFNPEAIMAEILSMAANRKD